MGLKPMNCPAHIQIYKTRGAPTATSRSATPRRASCTATSRAARSTACSASATSPRTTPTSSAPRSRSPTRSTAASTSATRSTTRSASRRAWSSPRGRRSGSAPRRCGTAPRRRSQDALDQRGVEYELNEGDGAFYGPKIDLHMTDSIGRSWQLGTVQLDYVMPERFDLHYTGADNEEHRPVMIHRALMGSFERFMGILIEHYAGEFPLWLAPLQALVLPVADRHNAYGEEVVAKLTRGRPARAARRPRRVRRAQDPRGGAGQGARTCSSSATATRRPAAPRCAATARATSGPSRSTRSRRGSVAEAADRRAAA